MWLLWSVKESAYKYLKRIDPTLTFSPAKIITGNIIIPTKVSNYEMNGEVDLQQDTFYTGTVIIASHNLHFKSFTQSQLIATAVNQSENFDKIYWAVHAVGHCGHQYQSVQVRKYLLQRLQTISHQSNLTIQNNIGGFPVILKNGVETNLLVSFSHHGVYVSYCFMLNEV